jgi:hypothetical protein
MNSLLIASVVIIILAVYLHFPYHPKTYTFVKVESGIAIIIPLTAMSLRASEILAKQSSTSI